LGEKITPSFCKTPTLKVQRAYAPLSDWPLNLLGLKELVRLFDNQSLETVRVDREQLVFGEPLLRWRWMYSF